MLYKPNFCCNCGERIERAEWSVFSSRRFCELCETEKKEYDYFVRGVVLAGFVAGLFGLTFLVIDSGGSKSVESPAMQAQNHLIRTASAGTSAVDPASARRPTVETSQADTIPRGRPANAETGGNGQNRTASFEPVYHCGALTKKGTPCTRRVKTKGTFCWQHASKIVTQNDRSSEPK
jgi:hypothetical protein